MDRVDEIKEILEEKRSEAVIIADELNDKLLQRKAQLQEELEIVRSSLGERVDGFRAWVSANKIQLLIGVGIFFIGFIFGGLA